MIIFLLVLFNNCSSKTIPEALENDNEQLKKQILVYATDSVGVFSYDLTKNKITKLAEIRRQFLSESLKRLNDSIIVIGFRSKIKFDTVWEYTYYKDSFNNIKTAVAQIKFTDTIFSINVRNYLHYVISTEVNLYRDWHLYKRTTFLNSAGKSIFQKNDTISVSSFSPYNDYVDFNTDLNKIIKGYSESKEINGTKIIAYCGNLYLSNGITLKLIRKFNSWSPKQGRIGYICPDLFYDKKFTYQLFVEDNDSISGIYEANLNSNKSKKILGSGFYFPKYSTDGNYIVCFKNSTIYGAKNRITEIYITDLKKNITRKISEGELCIWI